MDDAERQRTMDFILRQQAQFAASAQKNEEKMETLKRVVVAMARQFRKDRADLKQRIAALIDAQMRSEAAYSRLAEAQAKSEQAQSRADERMAALADAQAKSEEVRPRVDERIAALLDAQAKSEKKYVRSEEWRAQIEEGFARSNKRLAYMEDLTARNSEAIAKLTEVVSEMTRRRNGEGTA